MKRIINRQLRKCGLSSEELPQSLDEWNKFLSLVEESYKSYDEGRYLLERSLDISSKEMQEEIEKNKQMSLQLAQASKLSSLGTLASGIAHELNNPLSGILGYLRLLKNKHRNKEQDINKIERCEKLSRRMASIVNHLRKLARPVKDEDMEVIDILEPIEDAFELLGKQLELEGISHSISLEDSRSFFVEADHNRLESVFQNLITNSYHAFLKHQIEGEPFVKIRMKERNGNCLVTYEDNAGGMSKEVEAKVFDPFFTTKEVGEGTGIGMSISQQVIKDHKGELRLKNNPGIGVTFEITIPISSEDSKEKVSSLSDIQFSTHPKKSELKSILVVDDEEDICSILKESFDGHFLVHASSNPVEAINLIKKEHFDLLLTDIKMPKINGIQLAREVMDISPETKMVFMSGHLNALSGDIEKEFEGSEFILKPFVDFGELMIILNKALNESLE